MILGTLPVHAVASAATQSRPSDLEVVLARARASAGVASGAHTEHALVLEGRSYPFGAPADATLTLGRNGTFRETVSGSLGHDEIYDGDEVWCRYAGSVPVHLELAGREDALLTHWTRSGYWADERAPLLRTMLASGDDGSVRIGLRLEGGRCDATLSLDAETFLATRLDIETGVHQLSTTFEDYRSVFGLRIAHRVIELSAPGIGMREEITRASLGPEEPLRAPESLGPKFRDVHFDPAVSGVLEVAKLRSGHVLIRGVQIDGNDAGWFVFDTGASVTIITPETAQRLDLVAVGRSSLSGVGEERSVASVYRADTLRVGPLVVQRPALFEFDLARIFFNQGALIAGVIGWDVLSRTVVEFDFETPSIRILDAREFDPEPLRFLPLVVHGRTPHVAARFDGGGEPSLFRLDTGAPRNRVTFHSPAVERLRLLGDAAPLHARRARESAMRGAGGRSRYVSTTLDWFELAGRRFRSTQVDLCLDKSGTFADAHTDGSIGGRLLSAFVVTFDFSNARVALTPRNESVGGDFEGR